MKYSRLFVVFLIFVMNIVPVFGQEGTDADNVRFAIQSGDEKLLKTLIANGVKLKNVDSSGQPLMFLAALQPNPELIKLLEHQGLDVNITDELGYTPVMASLRMGLVNNALTFKEVGASLEGITKDGFSVRVLAEQIGLKDFGHEYKIKQLPLVTKEEANKLLLLAAEAGDWTAAEFALANGANIANKAPNGWSSLMLAALGGHSSFFYKMVNEMSGSSYSEVGSKVGDINILHAILLGKAKNEPHKVIQMLSFLKQKRPQIFLSSDKNIRKIVKRTNYRNYTAKILRLFPQSPLNPLDNELPKLGEPNLQSWKQVQTILKNKGLYKNKVDGKPGKGTMRALFAYYEPLTIEMRERCRDMMRRVDLEYRRGASTSDGFNILHFKREYGKHLFAEAITKNGKTRIQGYKIDINTSKRTTSCSFRGKTFSADKENEISCYESFRNDVYSNCSFKILSMKFSVLLSGNNYRYSFEKFDAKSITFENVDIKTPSIKFPELPLNYR